MKTNHVTLAFILLILLYESVTPGSFAKGRIKGGSSSYSRRSSSSASSSSSAYSSSYSKHEAPFQKQYVDNSYSAHTPTCGSPKSPMNGNYRCDFSSEGKTCTASCRTGYVFPDGSENLKMECSSRSGVWFPISSFPDCMIAGRNYEEDPYSQQHLGGSYQDPRYFHQLTSKCSRPKSPNGGSFSCQGSSEREVCTASCMPGYVFPDGSVIIRTECFKITGLWLPFENFPDCIAVGGNYQDNPYLPQVQQRGTCERPKNPENGQIFCRGDSYSVSCRATCNPGNAFPDGSREIDLTCIPSVGTWTPQSSLEDCQIMCHPPCENGGDCLPHNQCSCLPGYRGNRCQYPVSNCDFNNLSPTMVIFDCAHTPDFTECHISCAPGTTFNPPSSSIYRCTVDGHWNPPTSPRCVRDNLCNAPPSPQNGQIQCSGNSDVMICSAQCAPGYLFPEGFSQLISQCSYRTGQWNPTVNFPDCEPVCHPECENGGNCLGHNRCLCTAEFRGTRCQYPMSNCDGHEMFSAVAYECRHTLEETVCVVHCGNTGQVLDPAYPTEYTCSPDGRWQPLQRPKCTEGSLEDHNPRGNLNGGHNRHGGHEREKDEIQNYKPLVGFRGQEPIDHDFEGESDIQPHRFDQEPVEYEVDNGDHYVPQQTSDYDLDHKYVQRPVDYDHPQTNEKQQVEIEMERREHLYDLRAQPGPVQKNLRDEVRQERQKKKSSDSEEFEERNIYQLPEEDTLKKMKNKGESEREMEEDEEAEQPFDMEESSNVRGICSVWGYHHYRTFDSWVYTFPGTCTYLLASVCEASDATINVRYECSTSTGPCERGVEIHLPGDHFFITSEGLTRNESPWPIPTHVGPLTVERITRYIVARLTSGFHVWISDDGSVHVVATDNLKGRTCGLCGNFDNVPQNDPVSADGKAVRDVYAFGNSWKIQNVEGCTYETEEEMPCSVKTKEKRLASDKSSLLCASIFSTEFMDCQDRVKADFYYRMCQMDCCSLQAEENCECASMTQFFIECIRAGGSIDEGWRTDALCAMRCVNGTEYNECGPSCPPTCANLEPTCPFENCVDGCHCPPGTVVEDGQCIPVELCPCHYASVTYKGGETMQQDCNTCVCKGGQWQCTDELCPATCTVSGNHLTTFDGLVFDLMSPCSLYLIKHNNFSVIVETNTRCKNSPSSFCFRSITIHTPEGAIVKLKPGMEVTVNRQEIPSLPVSAPGVYVSQVTSIYMKAELGSGLEILWDGGSTVEVTTPPPLFGRLRGLCGTYTHSQADDFLTPEGDVEHTSMAFADKWKVDDSCSQFSGEVDPVEEKPCDRYPKRRSTASKLCRVLNGPQFEACHELVDQEPFYSICMDDVCGCDSRLRDCLCSSLASYASACARKGRPLPWRKEVAECGIHCDVGQVYEECANPCLYSCAVIAGNLNCKEGCVEGCVCPPGLTLDSSGQCVEISSCSCMHSGHSYPPEFLQRRGTEMCECSDGHWSCRHASASDIILTPPPNIATHCSAKSHEEFTECTSGCPLTCSNLHHHEPCTVAVCVPGCRCQQGYVLDTHSNICVLPRDCPCHHAGRSFEDGDEVKVDCNTCVCEGGQWLCETKPCSGLCYAWGNSHYSTFDGKIYDFQGECDYVLVRARVDDGVTYSVVIQNVPCGTGKVTCSKSVVVSLDDWNVILTRENPLASVSPDSRLTVSQVGMFTLVHSDIGISLQWDRTTRVYVIAEAVWKAKLQGLCGDFNGDSYDDFRPPSGGIPLVRAQTFADSWRVHDYCQPAEHVEDICDLHPERRVWAREKCAVLKSELFRPCHVQVELEPYYSRCVFDSCACDAGGDCQCLCAAVAAYAHECSRHDVIIPWRSQELCPVQCEACDRYSPCISLCPPQTCETLQESEESRSCSHEPCVDGCEPKPCKPGYVYKDLRNFTCVTEEECGLKPCIVINDVSYREGERIDDTEIGDPCQSCYCKHGEVECAGVPCTTLPPPIPIALLKGCELTGWTDWINSYDPVDNEDGDDFESLEELERNGRIPCPLERVNSIQCRDAFSEAPFEVTGQDVMCNLEDGLTCKHSSEEDCLDYEMRLYCDCVEKVTCAPDQKWDDCAYQCDSTCQSFLQDLKSSEKCGKTGECVPGCTSKVCEPPYFARDSDTCVLPEDCTCRLDTGYLLAPGEVVSNGCEKCQCLNNSLICSTLQECAPTTQGPTTEYTKAKKSRVKPAKGMVEETSCAQGWSPWINMQNPDAYGETEPLDDNHIMDGLECLGGHFTAIECRDVDTERLHHLSGLTGEICDLRSGYTCQNSQQLKGRLCPDYEIRTYCDCKGRTPAITTTSPILLEKQTKPSKLPAYPRMGIISTTPPCSAWSDWINNHRPRKGRKYGEQEDTLPFMLQQAEGFCLKGSITAIECKDAKKNRDYRETKESKLICSLHTGFLCHNADQSDGKCMDYKIRYFCDCGEKIGTEVSLMLTTATPSHVYPCDNFVLMIDGPQPLDDVRLKASSSLSPKSGPQSGRLSSRSGLMSEGSWTAGITDQSQFVEVDFGEPRAVYGVVTKGREDFNEWVTSYRLFYSPDGAEYTYYTDDKNSPKIFPANYDSNSPVRHILGQPFEARVVRLEPLTWEGHVSMRWDLLGCSEAVAMTMMPSGIQMPETVSETPIPYPWFEAVSTMLPSPSSEEEFPMAMLPEAKRRKSTPYPPSPPFEALSTTSPGSEAHMAILPMKKAKKPKSRILPFEASPVPSTYSEAISSTTPSYEHECSDFILLIDGSQPIDDEHLRASSSLSPNNKPQDGRLMSDSAWKAENSDRSQHIEVDLSEPRIIYGVVTKGESNAGEWVTSYRLRYSSDGVQYSYYADEKKIPKVFPGNYDSTSEVSNMLENPIEARIVSIEPMTWEGRISLRWDLLGCSEAEVVTTVATTTTPLIPIFYTRTTPVREIEVCEEPMGLENGLLSDSQLSASSHYDPSLSPEKGRIGSPSAWSAAIVNDNQYLQVDFLEPRNITGVVTKGREGVPQWVTAYNVAYSSDGTTWNKVVDNMGNVQEFPGNYDEESTVTNLLPSVIRTRYLRILPTKWKNWISLQAEVLGCFHPYECKEPMGLESGLVSNGQMSSSSAYDKSFGPESGRISSTSAWVSAKLDPKQYLQVDFLENVNLTAIVTKGRSDTPQWVTAFAISYSNDGDTWDKILDDQGVMQTFEGNTDGESAKTNVFPKPLSSRYLRILPIRWKGWISLRVEILGCHHPKVCQDPMGLEDGFLPDSQLSASSSRDSSTAPINARLNDDGAWSAGILNNDQYLQVDFLEPRNVTAVVTKGKGNEPEWVTSYQLALSPDGKYWNDVLDEYGEVMKFKANEDQNNPVVNVLSETVETRYLRVIPRKWKKWISIRLEVLGCYHPYKCREPMGIENGLVSDVQLSASTSLSDNLYPENARLQSDSAWAASTLGEGEYIQVDFITPQNVTAVVTRGRNDAAQWVTAYIVKVSDDGDNWTPIRDEITGQPKEFIANYDNDSPVTNTFPDEVKSRFLRILPTKWKNWISLRFDVLGCYHPSVCTDPMGMENGLLSDSQISASSYYDQFSKPANARLSNEFSSWAAETPDDVQFLQVDFLEPRNVTAIVTKGRPDEDHWVSSYYVSYSHDDVSWSDIQDEYGNPMEFPGNVDRDTPVINPLPEVLETRYLRILPKKWNNWISLRTEILGCFHPYPTKENITFITEEFPEYVKPLTHLATTPAMVGGCPDPMEEEDSLLDDAIISGSSTAPGSSTALIRLNTKASKGLSSGWVPRANDLHPIVFIQLPDTKWITSISIQGRGDADQWVKSFRVVASDDNKLWKPLYDPNGNEEMDGSHDQHTIAGHYFRESVAAKFVKIIPETWNKHPSFRLDLRGCSHTPFWPATTTFVPPLELCPEMSDELVLNCPSFCPPGLLCNGEKCVDPVDCVCVHNDKIFMVSDKFEDEDCLQCDCSLGGHSVCSPKICLCENGKQQVLHDNCSCSCKECEVGMQICPSSRECIPMQRWCDGIIDCPDDETNCIGKTTKTTEASTVAKRLPSKPLSTTVPAEIFTEVPFTPENATCEVLGKRINTFDGQDLKYDVCNHIILKDIEDGTFNITVHKECSVPKECKQWLQVNHENHAVKITSDLDVQFDGHHYTVSQLVLLSHKSNLNLTVEKVGEHVILKSLVKGFTVIYDVRAHLKVGVSPNLMQQVAGLCGFYSGTAPDDQQKPDGKLAFTSKEFGDSWAIDSSVSCEPSICPMEFMTSALQTCNELREDPFAICDEVLNIDTFVEFCMSSTCECLQQRDVSFEDCKCNSFMPFVESCESSLGPNALRNWRYKHACVPDCPPGLKWDDCGPSCQLTCDSLSMNHCSDDCMAGCFCPSGMVLNGKVCIPPDQCSDKVCQGFGDPHLETYDGLLYPFQAIGSFLITADEDTNFSVEGLTELCTISAPITCVVGLQVNYKGHQVRIRKNQTLIIDDTEVPMDMLPSNNGVLSVLGFPGRTFVISIPDVSVEVRYFEENAGFAVKIPSRRYFNKTIGLCGNCNANIEDELLDEPINDFVCSWLTDGDEETCKKSFFELPKVINPVEICDMLNDTALNSCHLLVDPQKFIDACRFDAMHSGDDLGSFCKTVMEYTRECCQVGIIINDWPERFGCNVTCPSNLEFIQCHDGCPQTCEILRNETASLNCHDIQIDGCFCPEGKILKNDECIDSIYCKTCDSEGHVPGSVWNDGPCKKCHCSKSLSIDCIVEICPESPVCTSKETFIRKDSDNETCCQKGVCIPKTKVECPSLDVLSCPIGEVAFVHISEDSCPSYHCKCDLQLCPPVITPINLEEGQEIKLVNNSCCPQFKVVCKVQNCPREPTCSPGLQLISLPGECCVTYKCKPPKDVCVYAHKYKVIDGYQVQKPPSEENATIYKVGDSWLDGLCENCSCLYVQSQLLPQCVLDHCPVLEDLPDNKDYELYESLSVNKCCPDIYHMKCKDEYGNLYEAYEEWQSLDDPCINFVCEPTVIGDVQKVKKIIECSKCPESSDYIPPSKKLGQCCGICRASKCDENGTFYHIGETWNHPSNPCQKAECINVAGSIKTIYTNSKCPDLPKDCPKDKIVMDEDGCCEVCNITSEISCSTGPIPLNETVGFFSFIDSVHGGNCINVKPVLDVLMCSGACHSQSYYSLEDGEFRSMCTCCKVNVTVNRSVDLQCPDGSQIKKDFLQPSTCQCSKCAPKGESAWVPHNYHPKALKTFENQEQKPFNVFQQEEEEDEMAEQQQNPIDFFQQEEEDSLTPYQRQNKNLYSQQQSVNSFQQQEKEYK